MRASFLLLGGVVAVVGSTALYASDPPAPPAAQTVTVNVRIDCLAGNGVSFSLLPWSITVAPGDSVNWMLDPGSNVDSMEVQEVKGKGWPFKKKTPYKARKGGRGVGARELDSNEKAGKYKYNVQAICIRAPGSADTVLIDPDMIIVRGGGGT